MKRGLRLAPNLTLPLEVAVETIAVLAKRGAGKTYTASVLVEEMLAAKLQVVVLDPMGAWWGLRSNADGDGEGYPIAVLGGERGDVPLEPAGGSLVADLVVDERLSAVLDLSGFSKNEWRRFVADFVSRLYQRNRDPMHVVLEEADLFAPEGKLKRAGDEQMLGAVYDLVRRGRGRGIGSTLITQRSASISKEVLTQAEILVALRTTGPHDRKAIELWIDVHGVKEERDLVVSEIASLPTGTAYVWWPVEGILRKVRIRERRTFDSSATPRPGQARHEPKTIADVDLQALSKAMATTIEKAKAEDPAELRKRIRALEQESRQARVELERRPAEGVDSAEVDRLNAEVAKRDDIIEELDAKVDESLAHENHYKVLCLLLDELHDLRERAFTAMLKARDGDPALPPPTRPRIDLEEVRHERADTRAARPPLARTPRTPPTPRREPPAPRRAPPCEDRNVRTAPAEVDADFSPSSSQQRVLDALAWFEALGIPAPSRPALAFIAGARPTSGGFKNNLGALRTASLIDYPQPNRVRLTEAGRGLAVDHGITPSDEALQDAVLAAVTGSQAAILQVLIKAYPGALSREELADAVGVPLTSGGFKNNLGALRTLEVIDYPSAGMVVALPVLFPVSEGGRT